MDIHPWHVVGLVVIMFAFSLGAFLLQEKKRVMPALVAVVLAMAGLYVVGVAVSQLMGLQPHLYALLWPLLPVVMYLMAMLERVSGSVQIVWAVVALLVGLYDTGTFDHTRRDKIPLLVMLLSLVVAQLVARVTSWLAPMIVQKVDAVWTARRASGTSGSAASGSSLLPAPSPSSSSGVPVIKLVLLAIPAVAGLVACTFGVEYLYLWCDRALTRWWWVSTVAQGHISPVGMGCCLIGSIALYLGSVMNLWPGTAALRSDRRTTAVLMITLAVIFLCTSAIASMVAITKPTNDTERRIEAAASALTPSASKPAAVPTTPKRHKVRAVKPVEPAGGESVGLTTKQVVAIVILILAQFWAAVLVLRATAYRPDLVGLARIMPVLIALVPIAGPFIAARATDAGARPTVISIVGVVAGLLIWFL